MKPYAKKSSRELRQLLELPKPKHPLISVIDFSAIKCYDGYERQLDKVRNSISTKNYSITPKNY